MEVNDLEIGKEVYYHERWSMDCNIGKIIGETPKYWRIQFGNSSPCLFDKGSLWMRGGDSWTHTKAYPLTDKKKNEIILNINKTAIERKINNFLRVGITLNNVNNGNEILLLADKIREIIKQDVKGGISE